MRKYDDGVGRFMSIDPLWEQYRSLSPYHYSRNNPLVLQDPSGLADFIDENGNLLGSDGNTDNREYVTTLVNFNQFTSNGVTDWANLATARGTELMPSKETRKEIMDDIVKPADGTIAGLQGEFGGVIAEDRFEGRDDRFVAVNIILPEIRTRC